MDVRKTEFFKPNVMIRYHHIVKSICFFENVSDTRQADANWLNSYRKKTIWRCRKPTSRALLPVDFVGTDINMLHGNVPAQNHANDCW